MDDLQVEIGKRIAAQRKKLHMSQSELAIRLDKSLRTVQKYENGEIDMSISVLEQISNILEMPISDLIGYNTPHIILESMADVYDFFFELYRKEGIFYDIYIERGPETIRKAHVIFDLHKSDHNIDMYNILKKLKTNLHAYETYFITYSTLEDWETTEKNRAKDRKLTNKEIEELDTATYYKRREEAYQRFIDEEIAKKKAKKEKAIREGRLDELTEFDEYDESLDRHKDDKNGSDVDSEQ